MMTAWWMRDNDPKLDAPGEGHAYEAVAHNRFLMRCGATFDANTHKHLQTANEPHNWRLCGPCVKLVGKLRAEG